MRRPYGCRNMNKLIHAFIAALLSTFLALPCEAQSGGGSTVVIHRGTATFTYQAGCTSGGANLTANYTVINNIVALRFTNTITCVGATAAGVTFFPVSVALIFPPTGVSTALIPCLLASVQSACTVDMLTNSMTMAASTAGTLGLGVTGGVVVYALQ
jgi:hypothetical protein